MRRVYLICALAVIVVPAQADSELSGTYVGQGQSGAFLLQVVETLDGHVRGRYEQVLLDDTGKIEDTNAAVDGASGGGTVVLSIKFDGLLVSAISASGSLESGRLHLTGSNLALNLARSDEADFRRQVAALNDRSNQIQHAVAEQRKTAEREKDLADFIAHTRQLTSEMTSYNQTITALLPNFNGVAAQYRNITERIRSGLARERGIYGQRQAAVARSQITVAISQAVIAANQVHLQVRNAYEQFNARDTRLTRDSVNTAQSCHSTHSGTGDDPVPSGMEAWNAACLALLDSAKRYWVASKQIESAFGEVEAVWREQRPLQEQLEREASEATN